MSKGLLLIDFQNDYFPDGKMELVRSSQASLNARELLSFFRRQHMLVIHVRHLSLRPGASFFLPGTAGAEIHRNVAPLPGETVIEKVFPNSFRDTNLLNTLMKEGIKQLAIAGMMTHMCVDATVRAAFDNGFSCTLAHDACATRDLFFGQTHIPADHVHAAFLSALSGIYAKVVSSKELIADFA